MQRHDPWADGDLQEARRALRHEKIEVGRWRRLLRARLDLVVGAYAPPEPLGTSGWEHLPTPRVELPLAGEMSSAIWASAESADRVDLMHRLRELDRRLGGYTTEIDCALENTTDALLARMGSPVAGALTGGLEALTSGATGHGDAR